MFWRSNKNAYLCKVKQEIWIMATMTLQIDTPPSLNTSKVFWN